MPHRAEDSNSLFRALGCRGGGRKAERGVGEPSGARRHPTQVASPGDRRFGVEKRVVGERAQMRVEVLDDNERVEEIARMGAGLEITDAAREHEREMPGQAK